MSSAIPQFSLLICSLLAVLGVIVFRFTHPKITRPYRVWAYPLPPIMFSVITIWMIFYLLRWHSGESLAGLVTALLACCCFCSKRLNARRKKRRRKKEPFRLRRIENGAAERAL